MHRILAAGGIALLASLAALPSSSLADTRVGITLGEGWSPAPYRPVHDPDYDDYDDDDYDYISCSEGRRIVRDYGFRQVRPIRCGDEIYRYRAVKRYQLWSVKVSARSGRIVSARPIGDYY